MGAGADARDEAEGEDQEDAGYCADGGEYACAFEAAEEAADDCAGHDGCAGDEVSELDFQQAQGDDEKARKGAGQESNGANRGGRAGNFDGAADYEAEGCAQSDPGNCAAQSPEEEPAHEPHQKLAGYDAGEAQATGKLGWGFGVGVQLGFRGCNAMFRRGYVKARGRGVPMGGRAWGNIRFDI